MLRRQKHLKKNNKDNNIKHVELDYTIRDKVFTIDEDVSCKAKSKNNCSFVVLFGLNAIAVGTLEFFFLEPGFSGQPLIRTDKNHNKITN